MAADGSVIVGPQLTTFNATDIKMIGAGVYRYRPRLLNPWIYLLLVIH
jgi:hypothetical protein